MRKHGYFYIYLIINLPIYIALCFLKNNHISFGRNSPNLIARNLFFGQSIEPGKNDYPPPEFDTISPGSKRRGKYSKYELYNTFNFEADMLKNVDIANSVFDKENSDHMFENDPNFFDIFIKCPTIKELKTYRWMKYMHDRMICNKINKPVTWFTESTTYEFEPLKADDTLAKSMDSLGSGSGDRDREFFPNPVIGGGGASDKGGGEDDEVYVDSEEVSGNSFPHPAIGEEYASDDGVYPEERGSTLKSEPGVGFDNSSYYSNLLILLNSDREILKRRCQALRLNDLLGLTNTDVMRLLIFSPRYLIAPQNFKNTVNFLLAFGRANLELENDKYKLWTELPKPLIRINVPSIYAMIGRKQEIAPKKLWKRRRSKLPPIRDEWPVKTPKTPSALSKWLDSAESLFIHCTKGKIFSGNSINDFSSHFTQDKIYNTAFSINRYDTPAKVDFVNEMAKDPKMLRTVRRKKTFSNKFYTNEYSFGSKGFSNEDDSININDWSRGDVRRMLLDVPTLGIRRTHSLINSMRTLHEVLGFSYKEILSIGLRYPQIFVFGSYKNHINLLYDCDADFTYKDVFYLVKKLPNLLSCNINRSIKPKIYYLRRNMGKSIKDLLEFPSYLVYSLRDRIIPRHFCIMNMRYKNHYDKVYKYLFSTGLHKSYGTPVNDERVIKSLKLPEKFNDHLKAYYEINKEYSLRDLIAPGDELFCNLFKISWKDFVIAKEKAELIPTPQDLP